MVDQSAPKVLECAKSFYLTRMVYGVDYKTVFGIMLAVLNTTSGILKHLL